MRQKLTVLIRKEDRRFLRNVKTMPGELQHALLVADIDKKNIMNVVRKKHIEGR